ncbi:MerR family transcriptional regulator [Ideonella livida]|uniref:MerR family transcriptional regulator n=1 Tax=Ideonella livida TaxID=2707176 RepID=A0A7C9TMY7_9BURK|nr:MerR family transcriptional regulator [Ideonella livida]NDY93343.1 MerR family transcriptional regulator [Ideonella livida]
MTVERGAESLPDIPAKRYFTIGEVAELCAVKPYVLRYWEQEFSQLRPMKRRGNRRYYQHHELLLVRRIRELLYEQGFTISGARNQLGGGSGPAGPEAVDAMPEAGEAMALGAVGGTSVEMAADESVPLAASVQAPEAVEGTPGVVDWAFFRTELKNIKKLLQDP